MQGSRGLCCRECAERRGSRSSDCCGLPDHAIGGSSTSVHHLATATADRWSLWVVPARPGTRSRTSCAPAEPAGSSPPSQGGRAQVQSIGAHRRNRRNCHEVPTLSTASPACGKPAAAVGPGAGRRGRRWLAWSLVAGRWSLVAGRRVRRWLVRSSFGGAGGGWLGRWSAETGVVGPAGQRSRGGWSGRSAESGWLVRSSAESEAVGSVAGRRSPVAGTGGGMPGLRPPEPKACRPNSGQAEPKP